jgi:hypothetical protein
MPARQYRLTITVSDDSVVDVVLAHRRFPCRADHWDGAERWKPHCDLPVGSFGDYLDVLHAISDAEFVEFWGPKRP